MSNVHQTAIIDESASIHDSVKIGPYSIIGKNVQLGDDCYIGNNETEIEKGAIAVSKFYNNFGAWFKNSRKVVQGTLDPLTQEEIDNNEMYSPKEMRKNQNIGTLQEVIDNVKRYEDLGFDEYSIWIDSHLSIDDKKDFLDKFITDVMPKFSS